MTGASDTARPNGTALPPLPAVSERVPAPQQLVFRDALFAVLSGAGPGTVVLLGAPAGSGKTVLLRSWTGSELAPGRVAWVSVERGELDAQRFWLSVVDALAGTVREEGLVERVGATPAFRAGDVVERLLASLGALDEPVVLVIDDLHELRSPEALRWLEHALAAVPPRLQVVLSTRVDPGLGLHRLRLTGDLVEIRGDDLRFTLGGDRLLLRNAGVALEDAAVARLHERTEGWAAGLRLAAISLAARPDREGFVEEFSGSERTVAAYLVAEVLERQPPDVRELLLRTSILDRVSGPLADALTGGRARSGSCRSSRRPTPSSPPSTPGATWFRYHHLFADLLRLELRRVAPASVGPLHRAAAGWFEDDGEPVQAIRHAQAGATGSTRRTWSRRPTSAWSSTAAWPRWSRC